jgi:arabinogalactan endo-1,4-beta-galactosidase
MIFENFDITDNIIIHCKDGSYREEYDNKNFYYNEDITYYRGYLVHRENGPSIERGNRDEEWWLNGKKHREGGPAILLDNRYKEWWLSGMKYSEQKYWKLINLKSKKRVLNDI